MSDLYSGSSFISQPIQDELDGKVSLVSATTQSIGSGLDVGGNINLSAGSEFLIDGVPIGGGGSNLPTIDTLLVTGSIENFSQTDITYIIGCELSAHIALNNFYDFPAGKTKTIIAEELNGKIVLVLTDGGIALSPGLSKNGQQQTFLWDGTKWTYDDNKITTRLVGWGTTPLTPPDSNTTIQSELQESGDINLLTGKKYKINAVNLEAVAETLTNKTISGSSNTILNLPISSTTGLQTALDGKVALVSATTQSIGSGLDVSGNINLTAGSEFLIDGVPIGGGSNLPTIDTLVVTNNGMSLSQTDITYIIGYTHNFYGATLELNSENLPAGKTKTIIAQELNGKIVIILDRLGNPISPNLTKNGQQQTFQWSGTDWTYDDNKITTNLLGWGGELGLPSNNNTTIQSELQQSGDINLLTGKKYKINSVNLEAVAETLTNKTISGSSNTILNLPISSTTGLQTALDGKVALVSATKQTIGSALDVSGNINLPTGSEYQINGVSITAGGGGGGTPGGVEGSVQYNASGAFAGESDFNYSASTNTLTLTNGTLRPSAINFNSDKIAITGNTTTTNQQSRAVAIGTEAGQTNQNVEAIAIGGGAGLLNQGIQAVAIGQSAGSAYQNSQAVAIGFSAGNEGQGFGSIAIGNFSGISYQGEKSIAIGSGAGGYSQARDSIAIGSSTLNSARYSICINATGDTLGAYNENSLVVAPIRTENDLTGLNSLFYNTTSKEIVVSGTEGGGTLRPEFINFSSSRVKIGGNNDANFENQESACIAIGYNAGVNNQATAGVAIGYAAGYSTQGQGAVALGWNAGHFYQGQNSVAIGNQAGLSSQYQNSICINATGDSINTPATNTCVIKPIRNETNLSGFLQLYYNPTTGELVYN